MSNDELEQNPNPDQPYKPINKEYWLRTYSALNPFMGLPRCPNCKTMDHLVERSWMEKLRPYSVAEFKCKKCDAEFERRAVMD